MPPFLAGGFSRITPHYSPVDLTLAQRQFRQSLINPAGLIRFPSTTTEVVTPDSRPLRSPTYFPQPPEGVYGFNRDGSGLGTFRAALGPLFTFSPCSPSSFPNGHEPVDDVRTSDVRPAFDQPNAHAVCFSRMITSTHDLQVIASVLLTCATHSSQMTHAFFRTAQP